VQMPSCDCFSLFVYCVQTPSSDCSSRSDSPKLARRHREQVHDMVADAMKEASIDGIIISASINYCLFITVFY